MSPVLRIYGIFNVNLFLNLNEFESVIEIFRVNKEGWASLRYKLVALH